MKQHRILSFLLTFALLLGAVGFAAAPARAAFRDVTDAAVLTDAEVLRALGVTAGTGNDCFSPDGVLDRAQFCTMAIALLGKQGAVGQYQTFTIFPDVRAGHWATGYINMAVRGEDKLISGFPDGTFHPDEPITFAQTVTILMHMLGYQDGDVGAAWPDGYLASAASIGLTDGLSLGADSRVTRAQAARLMCRLLVTPSKGGTAQFAEKLGQLVPETLILQVDATAADGTSGAVAVQDGSVYKPARRALDPIFVGRRGTLLLNGEGRVLTFLPDTLGSQKEIAVSKAEADGITDPDGVKYTLHSALPAYYQGKKLTYGEVFFELRRGMRATLYFDAAGRIDSLVIPGGVSDTQEAVVVGRNGSTAGFERLTGRSDYSIRKNGAPATAADLRQYDVAVYDAATNTVRVCDVKLSGYYADAQPNVQSPTKIGVLGLTLDVLPCAAQSLAKFPLGRTLTFLLTEDRRVAGAVSSSSVSGNAVGIATSVTTNSATVELFCGLTVKGDPKLRDTAVNQYAGQLVTVTSYDRTGQIRLTRLDRAAVRGALDVQARSVGTTPVSETARIYDRVGLSPLTEITLADLPVSTVPSERILYTHTDWAGRVDLLVLDNVTGDGYTYGHLRYTSTGGVCVEYGEGLSTEEAPASGARQVGGFGGLALYVNSTGYHIAGSAELERLADVPNEAWNGAESVTWQGMTYTVADDAVCYNRATGRFLSLTQARAFAPTADLYLDSIGQKIRVVAVGQA